MKQKINLVYVCNILLMLKSVKKASKNLIYISLMSLMYSHVMHDEIWRKKSSWIRPLDPNKPALNFFSTCWNVPDGDETFLFRFRFRREHFGDLMTQLNFFDDNNNIRYPKLGARPVDRMYVVANFLMNVITSFYGNQFTSATGMSPPTLEEILRRAQ